MVDGVNPPEEAAEEDAIAKHRGRKVLILNGHHDRETSHADYETVDGDSTTKRSCVHRLTASEVVWTIVNAIRSADGADDVQGGKGDKGGKGRASSPGSRAVEHWTALTTRTRGEEQVDVEVERKVESRKS